MGKGARLSYPLSLREQVRSRSPRNRIANLFFFSSATRMSAASFALRGIPIMRRRRRLWIAFLCILLTLVALVTYAAWPGRSTFTISPETTYVTGPLDAHGYI